jgi:hypothetical protein
LNNLLAIANKNIDNNVRDACNAQIVIAKIAAKHAKTVKGIDWYARAVLTSEIRGRGLRTIFIYADPREGAAIGLGLLRGRESQDSLKSLLECKMTLPYQVRVRAVKALADSAGRDVAPLLKQYATDCEECRQVRGMAAICYAQVLGGEINDIAIVNTIVQYPSPVDVETRPPLLEIAKYGKSKAVRELARQYLSKSDLETLQKDGTIIVNP